jgi:hypothetical protein
MSKQFTEFEVEPVPVVVPHALKGKNSLLSDALDRLCAGQVGDSFVARRPPSSVALSAKMRGLKVICRCVTPDEKDYKKRAYRVWRSDGHDMDTLNRLIQRRLNGETVRTEPVVPMDPDALRAMKDRKHPKEKK